MYIVIGHNYMHTLFPLLFTAIWLRVYQISGTISSVSWHAKTHIGSWCYLSATDTNTLPSRSVSENANISWTCQSSLSSTSRLPGKLLTAVNDRCIFQTHPLVYRICCHSFSTHTWAVITSVRLLMIRFASNILCEVYIYRRDI